MGERLVIDIKEIKPTYTLTILYNKLCIRYKQNIANEFIVISDRLK